MNLLASVQFLTEAENWFLAAVQFHPRQKILFGLSSILIEEKTVFGSGSIPTEAKYHCYNGIFEIIPNF